MSFGELRRFFFKYGTGKQGRFLERVFSILFFLGTLMVWRMTFGGFVCSLSDEARRGYRTEGKVLTLAQCFDTYVQRMT